MRIPILSGSLSACAAFFLHFLLTCLSASAATPQTLSWTGTTNLFLTLNVPHPIGATASSGLPVTLRVDSGPAAITNGTIIISLSGAVTVTAAQAGNTNFLPASTTKIFNLGTPQFKALGSFNTGGDISDLRIVGNYAYMVTTTNAFQILNISNPNNPVRAGFRALPPTQTPLAFSLSGDFAFVAEGSLGLDVIEITGQTNPVRVAAIDTPGTALGVQVVGNYAYVADGAAGLQIFNVSNPRSPSLAGSIGTGFARSVQVVGNYAYVANGDAGIVIIDVSVPSSPSIVASANTTFLANNILVSGSYAYVGLTGTNGGLQVFDISNPLQPLSVASKMFGWSALDTDLQGTYLYAASQVSGLQAVDISKPGFPLNVGGFPTPGPALCLDVVGNRIYAGVSKSLHVYEVSYRAPNTLVFNPPTNVFFTNGFLTLPQTSSSGATVIYNVTSGPGRIEGDRLVFTNEGFVRFRATQPDDGIYSVIDQEWSIYVFKPSQTIIWTGLTNNILTLNTPYPLSATASSGLPVTFRVEGPALITNGTLRATAAGTIVVIAEQAGNAAFGSAQFAKTFNVRQGLLRRVGGVGTGGFATAVFVSGNFAYVADSNNSLKVIDVSNPVSPTLAQTVPITNGQPLDVWVSGNFAYVPATGAGLYRFDLFVPRAPRLAGQFDTVGVANGAHVVGNFAYIADGPQTLVIVDVSNPTNMVRVGGLVNEANGANVRVAGNFAYLTHQRGMQIIDISNPASPVRVGDIAAAPAVFDVAIVGNYAFRALVGAPGGFDVVDISNPANPRIIGVPNAPFYQGSSLAVQDNYAYIAGDRGFQIFDVANRTAPIPIAGTTPLTQGIFVQGNLIFAAEMTDGLGIYEVTFGYPNSFDYTPPSSISFSQGSLALPVISSAGIPVTFSVASGPGRIEAGRLVFTGAGAILLQARQNTDGLYLPVNKEWTIQILKESQGVSFSAANPEVLPFNTPYPLMATASSGLPVTFRVESGPATITNGFITATAPGRITVIAEQLGNDRYHPASVSRVFNIRLVSLTRIGQIDSPDKTRSVQVVDNYAYTAEENGGFRIVDVSNPTNLFWAGGYDTVGISMDVHVQGTRAFLADGANGMFILNITNKSILTIAGYHPAASPMIGIEVSGNFAYVARERGLDIFDVSNPGFPVRSQILTNLANLVAFDYTGTNLYALDRAGGLFIARATTTSQPSVLGTIFGLGQVSDIKVVGTTAYVAVYNSGIKIIDVKNPSTPVIIGSQSGSGNGAAIEVSGDYAYVAEYSSGISVFDVADPRLPLRVGGTSMQGRGQAVGLYAVGNLLYVAAWDGGLQVFRIRQGYPNPLDFYPPGEAFVSGFVSLPPTSANGAKVNYSVVSGPGVVQGERLVFTGEGIVKLRGSQPDDGLFLPIDQEWTIYAVKEEQTISWRSPIGELIPRNIPIAVRAEGSSGLPAILRVDSGPAIITNGLITVTGPGRVQITAEQPGNFAYNPAQDTRVFNVPHVRFTKVGFFEDTGAEDVQVVGNTAYLTSYETGLNIIDVSNPATPRFLGSHNPAGQEYFVRVAGNIAYVASGTEGVHLLDISNPTNIVRLGGYNTPDIASAIQLVGNYLYVADGQTGLIILNVSNPANIVRVGGFNTAGTTRGLQVVGNFAYLADGQQGLAVLYVIDPFNPFSFPGEVLEGYVHAVQVEGRYAYMAGDQALDVIDLGNVANPVAVSRYFPGDATYGLHVVGSSAFLASASAGLQAIDVSNPTDLVQLGQVNSTGYPRNVQVHGNLAYVAAEQSGLEIFRVETGLQQMITWTGVTNIILPLNVPHPVGAVSDSGLPVAIRVVSGPAIIANGMITVTNLGMVVVTAEQPGGQDLLPATPLTRQINLPQPMFTEVSRLQTDYPMFAVSIAGQRAYVAQGEFGLGVISITNRADPVLLGEFQTGGYARDVQIIGNHAYLADAWEGLQILDITNPTNILRVGHLPPTEETWRLHVVGNFAYMAEGNAGLTIANIANPTNAAYVAPNLNNFETYIDAVQAVGDLVYVLDRNQSRLQVFTVTNRAAPAFLGETQSESHVRDFYITNGLAYTGGSGGLQIFDIRNPAAITRLSGTSPGGGRSYNAVQVAGSYAYALRQPQFFPFRFGDPWRGALEVFDVSDPTHPISLGGILDTTGVDLQIVGDYAYIAVQWAGLRIYKLGFAQPGVDLAILRVGPQLEISWPAGIPGLKLESSVSLADDAQWIEVRAATTQSNGRTKAMLDGGSLNRFFRVRVASP